MEQIKKQKTNKTKSTNKIIRGNKDNKTNIIIKNNKDKCSNKIIKNIKNKVGGKIHRNNKEKYIIILSNKYQNLSLDELVSLSSVEKIKINKKRLKEGVHILNLKKKQFNNIKKAAYIKFIYEVIGELKGIDKDKINITKSQLKKIKQPYSVRVYDLNKSKSLNPTKFADKIWDYFKNNKITTNVKLKDPKTEIYSLLINNKSYITIKRFGNKNLESYRKSHLRPNPHPTSLDPKIAKACINILTSGKKKNIIDPMCGSGGILIEAALLGNNIIGFDIDEKMISRCIKNLKHYNILSFNITKRDALTYKGKFKNMIVDMPYGKNSKLTKRIKELYTDFIKKVDKNSIIMIPDFMKKIALTELKKQQKKHYVIDEIYLHKNLKKIIVKIE